MLFVFLSLASFVLASSALDVHGRINWNHVCTKASDLGRAKIILDNGKYSGNVVLDGSFTIPNVPIGTYILSVSAHDYAFDQLRIDVVDESVVEARPYVPGTPLEPASTVTLPYPLVLNAKSKYNYFVPPDSFNIMGMLSSPMVLMMIFAGGMMLGMPYLMKNLDPEAMADVKEQQAKMAQMQSAMASGDFKSGFSALMSGFEEPQQAPKAQSNAPSKKKGGNKKR